MAAKVSKFLLKTAHIASIDNPIINNDEKSMHYKNIIK